jgi:predicted secreted Zn-dependent protease
MYKTRNTALVAWLSTIAIFIALIALSATYSNFQSAPTLQKFLQRVLLLDISIGIVSFLVLIPTAILRRMGKDVHLHLVVKIFLVLVALVLSGVLIYLVDKQNAVLQSQPAQNSLSKNDTFVAPPINNSTPPSLEEPKHGYQAGALIDSKSRSYMVSGRTREDLCDAVSSWEEKENKGNTLAYIDYTIRDNYYTIDTSRGFTIGHFTVTAESTITVPQWSSSEGASDGTKSDWRAFKNAVSAHEQQHRDILVEYSQKLVNAYNNLGYYPTEIAFNNGLKTAYDKVYAEMESAQKSFDKKHGESDSFTYLCR